MNASLFEWVIENLIKNAIDAIGSDKGKILVTLEEKENTIEIEVADNGKGINPKNRKDIFRPGYSTKSRGPNTEPCGTPLVTPFQDEVASPSTTRCLRPDKNDSNQPTKSHLTPEPLSL